MMGAKLLCAPGELDCSSMNAVRLPTSLKPALKDGYELFCPLPNHTSARYIAVLYQYSELHYRTLGDSELQSAAMLHF